MEPSFNYLPELPVNGPPMILNRVPVEKCVHLQSLLVSLVNERPAKFPSGAPTVNDFLSRALLPYPCGSPEKEPSSNRAPAERDSPLPKPYYLLKFPVYGTPQVLQWAPAERDTCLQSFLP